MITMTHVETSPGSSEVKISVRNITRVFREATTDDRVAGRSWYATARDLAQTLDPEDPRRAAAVIAVISPMLSWPRNVKAAQDIYAGRETRGVLHKNVDKAKRILAGQDPEDVVTGSKVRTFWRTIANPTDPRAVVVDRHAIDVAAGRILGDDTRGRYLGRRGGYDTVSDAYRRAARIITRETGQQWTPADVQATTWIVWRREHAVANHG
jgi:hypothetical protein